MQEAISGSLIGTAVGDAMGLPYEGLSAGRIAKLLPEELKYNFFFGKGFCSDDTEHTCLLIQALIESGDNIDYFKKKFAFKLRFWLLGLPAGIGFATLKAIIRLWFGFSPEKSGVFSAGNGPAMRSAIVGVCFGDQPDKLYQYVKASTQITHRDLKAFYGAFAVAVAAWFSTKGKIITPDEYYQKVLQLLENDYSEEFFFLLKKICESVSQGETSQDFLKSLGLEKGVSGYIYHTLPAVLHIWLRNQNDYPQAISEAIICGGDTDTTAAIIGGIVGAGVGKKGIPEKWQKGLAEFPRNLSFLVLLAERLTSVIENKKAEKKVKFSLLLLMFRNIFFLIIVLLHGFRRLLPPY